MSSAMQEIYDINMSWSDVEEFLEVFPGRWHNTPVQLLAACGILGFLAYAFHRLQTVQMFLKRRTVENIFIAASILVLLGLSLLDCHFFNIGPGLVYSGFLAFAQHKTGENL
jgi:O-antigen ligase